MKAAQRKYKPHVEDPEGDIKRRLKNAKQQEVLRNGVGMVGADVIGLMQRRQLMLDQVEAGESCFSVEGGACRGSASLRLLLNYRRSIKCGDRSFCCLEEEVLEELEEEEVAGVPDYIMWRRAGALDYALVRVGGGNAKACVSFT